MDQTILGGTLDVTSTPGKGTIVTGELPTESAHTEEA